MHLVTHGGDGADAGVLRVVDQDHDVGQLEGRLCADAHPRGDPLEDGRLGRADRRGAALLVAVGLQVDLADHAGAEDAVGLHTLDIDQGIVIAGEEPLRHVAVHGAADGLDPVLHVRLLEIDLGQHEAEGRGGILDIVGRLLPIAGVAGELVTGDDAPPLGEVDVLDVTRQEDVCRGKDLLHKARSFLLARKGQHISLYQYSIVWDNCQCAICLLHLPAVYAIIKAHAHGRTYGRSDQVCMTS